MSVDTNHHPRARGAWDRPEAAAALNNPKSRSRSVLDSSVRLTGDLWSEGDVQIDGHLCGNISCVQLIVSTDAAVTGVIVAEEAVIRGKTTGVIIATRLLLQRTARVESEIIYQSLMVDEGASIEGFARQRPNPLDDFSMAPSEGRQRIGRSPGTANWSPAKREMAGQAEPLAEVEERQQLPARTADTQRA